MFPQTPIEQYRSFSHRVELIPQSKSCLAQLWPTKAVALGPDTSRNDGPLVVQVWFDRGGQFKSHSAQFLIKLRVLVNDLHINSKKQDTRHFLTKGLQCLCSDILKSQISGLGMGGFGNCESTVFDFLSRT